MSTPHINAKPEDFAKTVLMPGDPLRSRFIAENFLENPVLVNNVRGVQGYTGTYKGKRVSVMASGMGMPSMGIYSYELFNFFDVENIIRIGSAGAIHKDIPLRSIVIGMGACYNTVYADQFQLPGHFTPIASFDLLRRAVDTAEAMKVDYRVGNLLSNDLFYDDGSRTLEWQKLGVLAVEMEAAALYMNAARAGKKALCICTVSDSFVHPEENTTAQERETSFTQMVEIALTIAYA